MATAGEHQGGMYGVGARELQQEFDSRRLADRLVELTVHDQLDDGDIELIRDQASVLVATVDADGWPDVSYKGGLPGFIDIVDPSTLRLPFYNGNGMWRTLGNVRDNGRVALLFVDQQRPWRMRVHGIGVVFTSPEAVAPYLEAEAVLEIRIGRVFPNCGRYVHAPDALSPFVPRPDRTTPIPDWKRLPPLREVLPASDPARDD